MLLLAETYVRAFVGAYVVDATVRSCWLDLVLVILLFAVALSTLVTGLSVYRCFEESTGFLAF